MNAPDECPLTQQAVGWALHALEPDEEMAVLLHMPQCAACRAAAHDAEQVLSGLAGVVPLVEPPAGLRQRLMAEVAETPQRPHVLRPLPPQPAPSDVPEPATAARLHRLDAEDAGSVRRGWFGQGSRSRRLVAASLAVAAAISIGALVVRTNQLEQQRDAESAQAQSLSRLITELGEPDSRYALLADATTGATVAAVLVADGERQVYSVALPANGANSVYVAWGLTARGEAVPLGTFDVARTEEGPLPVGPAGEAEDFPQYAVSIEPGRVAPTTPTVVVASGAVAV